MTLSVTFGPEHQARPLVASIQCWVVLSAMIEQTPNKSTKVHPDFIFNDRSMNWTSLQEASVATPCSSGKEDLGATNDFEVFFSSETPWYQLLQIAQSVLAASEQISSQAVSQQ